MKKTFDHPYLHQARGEPTLATRRHFPALQRRLDKRPARKRPVCVEPVPEHPGWTGRLGYMNGRDWLPFYENKDQGRVETELQHLTVDVVRKNGMPTRVAFWTDVQAPTV